MTMMAQTPAPQTPQTPAAAAEKKTPKVKKKGGKGKWIVLGVVAAGATVALVVLNTRLGNEGHGIF